MEVLDLYETQPGPSPPAGLLDVEALVVFSPSGGQALLSSAEAAPAAKVIAIGPTTAAALESLGWDHLADAQRRDLLRRFPGRYGPL